MIDSHQYPELDQIWYINSKGYSFERVLLVDSPIQLDTLSVQRVAHMADIIIVKEAMGSPKLRCAGLSSPTKYHVTKNRYGHGDCYISKETCDFIVASAKTLLTGTVKLNMLP